MFKLGEDHIGHADFEVRSFDADSYYYAKLPFFFSLNQEMGGLHANACHCGIADLYEAEGKTWIITRTRMEIDRLPKWEEVVHCETWPQKGFHLNAPRVVIGRDDEGQRIFQAMSHWVVMDVIRKRPLRPNEFEDRLKSPDENLRYVNPELPRLTSEGFMEIGIPDYVPVVLYYDTDYNRHVNNVSYINWMIDALPYDFLKHHRAKVMDVSWKNQTYAGENIRVVTLAKNAQAMQEDNPILFSKVIRTNPDGTETVVFEAETEWVRK